MAKAFLESPRLDDQQYAMHLLTKAAGQGLRDAQFLLGERYYRYPMAIQDYISAYTWYALARDTAKRRAKRP